MLQNFLLIITCGLLTLTSVGFLIGGLINRNQKMWIAALGGIVVFFTGTALSVSNAVYDTVDYAKEKSEEFQEAADRTAKEFGQAAGKALSKGLDDLDSTLKNDPFIDMLREGAGNVTEAVVAHPEDPKSELGPTLLVPDSSVTRRGIRLLNDASLSQGNSSSSYRLRISMEPEKAFDGTLSLHTLDSDSLRTKLDEVHLEAEKGKIQMFQPTFEFEHSGDGWTGFCILSYESSKSP
jgi:hypothetical protein